MKKAIYGFSGDPITLGHIDIIKRALDIFGELTVGIGMNPTKKYFFNQEERRKIAEASLKYLTNVEVVSFKGLLVDYAFEQNIKTVIRGIRNSEDLNYELMLHQIGESQKQQIDTLFFPARQELVHVSSGAVKALQLEQGLIHEYVPLVAKQQLEERISKQTILSITGEIGVGKSYLSKQFQTLGAAKGIEVHVIDIDKIGHQILGELEAPLYQEFRTKLASEFGKELLLPNGFIDRQVLGKIIFNNPEKLTAFNTALYKPLLLKLRRELYGKRGIVLLDTALISESKMSYLSNNNVILVSADTPTQTERLKERGYSELQIKNRINSQHTHTLKEKMLNDCIEKDHHGKLWKIDNSGEGNEAKIEQLFEQVVKDLLPNEKPKNQ